jgi:hypothetical protein
VDFFKIVVAFPAVAVGGQEGKELLEVVEVTVETARENDETPAGGMRRALEALAAALAKAGPDASLPRGVYAALDGAELVTRAELARGNGNQLPLLLPSFVFLVALPIAGEDEALALARRTECLIERAPADG